MSKNMNLRYLGLLVCLIICLNAVLFGVRTRCAESRSDDAVSIQRVHDNMNILKSVGQVASRETNITDGIGVENHVSSVGTPPASVVGSAPIMHSQYFEKVEMAAPRILVGDDLDTWRSKRVDVWGGVEGEVWRAFNFSLPIPIANCGFSSVREEFITNEKQEHNTVFGRIAVALAPEAWSWQHFMQDVMPKIWFISEAMNGLQNFEVDRVFLLPPCRDKIIYEIMNYLKISYTIEPTLPMVSVSVRDAIIACKVPGVHPRLWRGIHSLLYVRQTTHARVILISRRKSKNGRQEPNTEELVDVLNGRNIAVQEFEGGSLQAAQAELGGASIMIGSHGGGLFNLMFMPATACVIENQAHDVFHGISINPGNVEIFYVISTGIGQTYWKVVAEPAAGYAFVVPAIVDIVQQCLTLPFVIGGHRGSIISSSPPSHTAP